MSPRTGLFSFRVAPLGAELLQRAAQLRASADGLHLPDAIHLATAESEQCDWMLTNDRRLEASEALPVVVLSDI